jgi:hypothetical protein
LSGSLRRLLTLFIKLGLLPPVSRFCCCGSLCRNSFSLNSVSKFLFSCNALCLCGSRCLFCGGLFCGGLCGG